jgi:hypothetical protein
MKLLQSRRRRKRARPASDSNLTIDEFCTREALSRAKYFVMRRQGRGPREMRDGKWIRISVEARADWRREREGTSTCA